MKDTINLTVTMPQAEYLLHELSGHTSEHEIPRRLYAMIRAKQTEWLAQQRAENELRQQLFDALLMPFDQALPIVKRFVNADLNLLYDKRVAAWCKTNSKAIQASAEYKPPYPQSKS